MLQLLKYSTPNVTYYGKGTVQQDGDGKVGIGCSYKWSALQLLLILSLFSDGNEELKWRFKKKRWRIGGRIQRWYFYTFKEPGIYSKKSIPPAYVAWARIFKRLWSPGIDSKEWIPPAYVACAGIVKQSMGGLGTE